MHIFKIHIHIRSIYKCTFAYECMYCRDIHKYVCTYTRKLYLPKYECPWMHIWIRAHRNKPHTLHLVRQLPLSIYMSLYIIRYMYNCIYPYTYITHTHICIHTHRYRNTHTPSFSPALSLCRSSLCIHQSRDLPSTPASHIQTNIHTYTQMHTNTSVFCVSVGACVCLSRFLSFFLSLSSHIPFHTIHTHSCKYTHTNVYTNTCIYVYMSAYTYTSKLCLYVCKLFFEQRNQNIEKPHIYMCIF